MENEESSRQGRRNRRSVDTRQIGPPDFENLKNPIVGQNVAMCGPLNYVLSLRCPCFKTTTATDKGFYFPINI